MGDSIVRWVGKKQSQLAGAGTVVWKGQSGARIQDLYGMLDEYLWLHGHPHTLVIHIGTNDVFKLSKRDLFGSIESLIVAIRSQIPATRLVWSDIIPRLLWYGELEPGAGERVRRAANARAFRVCKETGGDNRVIRHEDITQREHRLFRRDGIHLDKPGEAPFRRRLELALQAFHTFNKAALPIFPQI